MKSVADRFLSKSFLITKKILLSNKRIRNAVFDVYNNEEFSDLYEYEKMLADTVRMNTYHKAILKHISKDDRVLDLGTGSGILSMFAAQCNPKKLYAIDHSGFIEVAQKAAKENGISGIDFQENNSRSFECPEKLDVLLHEQIGDDLFDENMIENILDIKRRVLKKGGKVLPGKFELYLEPVSLKPDFRVLYIWEHPYNGFDFGFLKNSLFIPKYTQRGYNQRFLEPYAVDFLMCRPSPIMTIDFNQEPCEPNFNLQSQTKLISQTGQMDGVCLYFNVFFDEEISFSTSPLHKKTSWNNRMYRVPAGFYHAGDEISLTVDMPTHLVADTWSVTVEPKKKSETVDTKPAPVM